MFLPSLVKKVTQYSLKNFFTDVRPDAHPLGMGHLSFFLSFC